MLIFNTLASHRSARFMTVPLSSVHTTRVYTGRVHGPCPRPVNKNDTSVHSCDFVISVSNMARKHGCHFLTLAFTGRVIFGHGP